MKMTRARKFVCKVLILLVLIIMPKANSQIGDGGAGWANYVYLIKIYQENLKRFIQIKEMIDQARSHDDYIRALNSGLNNAIGLAQVTPLADDQILRSLSQFQDALKKVEEIYGLIPKSSDEALHKLHDMTIAESLKLANTLQDYALIQEKNAANVFYQSTTASPKGAERMNAQMSAQVLHSINQLIKVNGQMLKMQSESLAFTNKQDKDQTAGFNKTSKDLRGGMNEFKPNYTFPRF